MRLPALLCCLQLGAAVWAQPAVNPDAALVKTFEDRVGEYMKLRGTVESKLPALKPTGAPATIKAHERDLARGIREARGSAKQGDIFSPEIAAQFRRLVGFAMHGRDAARIKSSLKSSEPVKLSIQVNGKYPEGAPLQSTPPTLLMNLPALPRDLDYRIVDHTLVLRDAKANLILDFIPNAIP